MVETVTINTEDKGPSLEEQAAAQEAAAAAAKGEDAKLAGEETPKERPENIPEKFWDAEKGEVNIEAMAKSYAELEKARSKGESSKEGEQAAAEEAVEAAGLDMAALQAEYDTNGELTDESYEALGKVGISKEMVDQFIKGAEAQAMEIQSELLEPVGGSLEAYTEMTAWAADNLSDKEVDDFNKVLDSGNVAAIKAAVANLNAKYTDANGSEPGRQLNGKGGNGGTSVYESTADLMKDMQNPEYERNPAFRAKVEAKLARSSIL
jgi:hypothetical protein